MIESITYNNLLIVPQTLKSHFGTDFDSREFGVIDINSGDTFKFPALHIRGPKSVENTENLQSALRISEEYERLEGNWFYGGICSPHFGHFFSESIHRLKEYIENQHKYDGLVFLPSPFRGSFDWIENLPPYIKFTFESHFGISISNIKWILEKTVVNKLTVHKQASSLGNVADKDYIGFLRQISQKYENSNFTISNYVFSRTNYITMGRCLGLDYIFRSLNGFHVISPENYSIEQQIENIVNADIIIIEEGSAIHLLDLIGYTKAQILFISRRGRNGRYWKKMYQNKCKDFCFFDNVKQINHSLLGGPGVLPSVLSLSKIETFLKDSVDNYKVKLDTKLYYEECSKDLEKIINAKKLSEISDLYIEFEEVFNELNSTASNF